MASNKDSTPVSDAAAGFVDWARIAARPIDDDSLVAAAGDARLVALGEFTHGAHEPLDVRNQMIQALADRGLIGAVALESGLIEGRRLNDYVMGGPGDAVDITRSYLTWGFGDLLENVALLEQLRRHNSRPGAKKISLHGFDIPGGIELDMGDISIAITDTISYLERADAPVIPVLKVLSAYSNGLSLEQYFDLTPAAKADLADAARGAVELLAGHGDAYVAATSLEAFAWAQRTAIILGQTLDVFSVWPEDNRKGDSPRGMYRVGQVRDEAMADNLMWLLAKHGAEDRVLYFASNNHIERSLDVGPVIPEFPRPPVSMGQILHARLGRQMRIILTATGKGLGNNGAFEIEEGSFARRLGSIMKSPFVLNIDEAPPLAWLEEPRKLGVNLARLTASPRGAFDSVIYFPEARRALKAQDS